MTRAGRCLGLLLTAALLCGVSGCFGGSQNPSYFPYLLPTGDLIRTHAKPIGPGYYANFDPHAVEVAIEPQTMTSQVGSQVVVLATVRDEKGTPRRSRRVEWKVTNGNLIEVDESGCLPGRGGIEGNTAFSFTGHFEQRLSRGNNNQADDIMLRPGQTWCVVSSPVEGDTHVQAMVPGIFNWDKRMKTTVVRWVDAVWEFPPRGVAKFGTEHEFVTKIARFTDRQPLTKYRVRYKILDGPQAVLLPSRTQEEVVVSDLNGNAKVRIAQVGPASGVNRVSVEIIRPPDPTTPTGAGVSIVTGETAVEWLSPDVKLSHVGPVSAVAGQNVTYATSAKNEGRIDSQWVEFTLPIPDGLEFVSSNPPAEPRNGSLVYPFPVLGIGQLHTVQTTFKSGRAGPVKSVALMRTAEGQNDQKEVNTLITTPGLNVDILAPKAGIVDAPITYTLRLSNPGTGDLDDIQLMAEYDIGLEHAEVKNPQNDPRKNVLLSTVKGGLKGGATRDEVLVLTPRRAGMFKVTVKAASGGLQAQSVHTVTVDQPKVSLQIQGPEKRFVSRPAEYRIIVKNEGAAEQTGVVVRDRLPPELGFKIANRGGTFAAGEVTWNVGTIKPGEEIALDLTTECLKAAGQAEKVTLLTGDGNVRAERSAKIQIDGIAALELDLTDLNDPVEVGKKVVYRMTLTNTGSAPATKIDVKATVPDQLKAIRADGPTKGTPVAGLVTFDTVDAIQPGAKVTFLFECEALKAGRVIFRVDYTSSLNPQNAIIREEPTTIVAPFQAPVGPAQVPPPPGGGEVKPLPSE